VLYWMTAARRTAGNFALERAADWARRLGQPLVVLEALRCDYPWASDRLHRFIIDGMVDNRRALAPRVIHQRLIDTGAAGCAEEDG
jgi:deoxyribodipyrimidine photo-lyase